MKVLMPVLHYPPVIGGLEMWTKNIAENLQKKGVKVFIVTGKVKGEPSTEIKNGVKIFRTSLFCLKDLSHSSLSYIFFSLGFLFLKSLHLILKENIQLLHCQGFLSGVLGYFLSKITKVPYIVTVQKVNEKKDFLRKLVYTNASCCIGASKIIGDYFKEIGVKNIKIIPNGVDFEKVKKFNIKKPSKKEIFNIVFVGRLEKRKGVKYLIESLKFLKIEKFCLLIVGDGPERKKLEKYVGDLGLKEKVKFVGDVSNEEVFKYLLRSHCFVLPSISEGFGIAILEAQLANVPVVATKVGGILDIIENGKNGLLVEPQNPKELAECLRKIYLDEKLSQTLVKNARENLKKYDWKKISDEVLKVYLESLNL